MGGKKGHIFVIKKPANSPSSAIYLYSLCHFERLELARPCDAEAPLHRQHHQGLQGHQACNVYMEVVGGDEQ